MVPQERTCGAASLTGAEEISNPTLCALIIRLLTLVWISLDSKTVPFLPLRINKLSLPLPRGPNVIQLTPTARTQCIQTTKIHAGVIMPTRSVLWEDRKLLIWFKLQVAVQLTLSARTSIS